MTKRKDSKQTNSTNETKKAKLENEQLENELKIQSARELEQRIEKVLRKKKRISSELERRGKELHENSIAIQHATLQARQSLDLLVATVNMLNTSSSMDCSS